MAWRSLDWALYGVIIATSVFVAAFSAKPKVIKALSMFILEWSVVSVQTDINPVKSIRPIGELGNGTVSVICWFSVFVMGADWSIE